MLEGAIALELVMGKFVEGTVIAFFSFSTSALAIFRRVGRKRTGRREVAPCDHGVGTTRRIWKLVPAAELVPGDLVKLSLGGVVPADAKVLSGEVLLDQSLLTGESAAVEAADGVLACRGLDPARRAVAKVSERAPGRKFGRTAELVRTAHVVSTQQDTVFSSSAISPRSMARWMTAYAYFLRMRSPRSSPRLSAVDEAGTMDFCAQTRPAH